MRKLIGLLKTKKIATYAVLAASSIAFLTLGYVSWRQASVVDWVIDWRPLVPAVAFYAISLSAATIGWHLICIDFSLPRSFRTNARIYILSNAARRLPGGVWGIGSRLYLYRLEGTSEIATSMAIAVETAAVGLSVVLITLVLIPFLPFSGAVNSGWPVLALMGVGFATCLHPRILRRMLDFISGKLCKGDPISKETIAIRRVLYWLCSFGLAWVVSGILAFLIMRSIYAAPLALAPAVLGAWIVAGAVSMIVVIAPSGFGITELAFAALLATWVPIPVAMATALAMRLFVTACEMLWAVALVRWR